MQDRLWWRAGASLVVVTLVGGLWGGAARAGDASCVPAPTQACVLDLATEAARQESSAGDRLRALMHIAFARAGLGDAAAIRAILAAEPDAGRWHEAILRALVPAELARGDTGAAILAAAGLTDRRFLSEAREAIARHYLSRGDDAGAEALARGLPPSDDRDRMLTALAERAAGQGQAGAVDRLLGAIQPDGLAHATRRAAVAAAGAGQGALARRLADGIAGQDSPDALAALAAAGRAEAAAQMLERLVAAPSGPDRAALVDALLEGGGDSALVDLARATAAGEAEALATLARADVAAGRLGAAESALAALSALLNPEHPEADSRIYGAQRDILIALARARAAAGDRQAALAALDAALQVGRDRTSSEINDSFHYQGPESTLVPVLLDLGEVARAETMARAIPELWESSSTLLEVAAHSATPPDAAARLIDEVVAAMRGDTRFHVGFGIYDDGIAPASARLARAAAVRADRNVPDARSLVAEAVARALTLPDADHRALALVEVARLWGR